MSPFPRVFALKTIFVHPVPLFILFFTFDIYCSPLFLSFRSTARFSYLGVMPQMPVEYCVPRYQYEVFGWPFFFFDAPFVSFRFLSSFSPPLPFPSLPFLSIPSCLSSFHQVAFRIRSRFSFLLFLEYRSASDACFPLYKPLNTLLSSARLKSRRISQG